LTDKDEKELLREINILIKQFDMLIGWNSKDFDLPYLIQRMQKHKISTEYLWNILHEDMMRRVQYFYMKDPEARQAITSYGLDFCSQYFIGEGKVKHDEGITELWGKDPERFKKYNIQDCKLLLKLEKKLGIIEITHNMFQWCQVFPQNWSMVKTIDNFILNEANKRGIHYITNYSYLFKGEEEETKIDPYLGAFVMEPKPGLYKNVFVFDFKSLYPNIIRTFNISPETVDLDGKIETPIVFIEGKKHGGQRYKEDLGIIPEKIGGLLEHRNKIKEQMKNPLFTEEEIKNLNVKQLVVKELTNSIYGVLGNKWFRSFSIPLAESITATGQYLQKYVTEYLQKTGRQVIYGDTDSVFSILKGKEDPTKVAE
ncbi:MAG: DNA polymerase domain-containing protein, partial [Nanoarchaeota archaeon]